MDHKGKAVDALEPIGVEDARLELQICDDFQVIVFVDLLRLLANGGHNHGVKQVRPQGVTLHHGCAVNHHVHAFDRQLRQALITHG